MSEEYVDKLLSNFCRRIREIRTDNDESQVDLADAIGTSQTMVARYERGASMMSVLTLIKICAHYKVSADYLLGIPESYSRPR